MNFEQAFFDELVKIAVNPSSVFHPPKVVEGLGKLRRLGAYFSGETSIPEGSTSPLAQQSRARAAARGRRPFSAVLGGIFKGVHRLVQRGVARKRVEELMSEPRATIGSAAGIDKPAGRPLSHLRLPGSPERGRFLRSQSQSQPQLQLNPGLNKPGFGAPRKRGVGTRIIHGVRSLMGRLAR